ncbi:TetR/AcrR family transcriptional regulator [Nocardia sp. CA2R105]|uniref:TetR family transcriptional regulator n=1 Tax=Nocardia coffeae TaxID=2873381 RepID=UPI001CA72DF7|nr:TetR family transcriptional regulator [Nocardia coffeae]MBY8861556.1 TetR/AcrR family transcriptional regulator [Nocardia coffeae]
MARWEPDARGRLAQAALELYLERGFDQATVAEIAERAGLTERTFFRHYGDKREVLFGGQEALHELISKTVAEQPDSAAPMVAMGAALTAFAELFAQRRDFARQRQIVIDANASLQERELIKLTSLAATAASALRDRGVTEPAASLAAEAGLAAFRIAFARWIQAEDRELTEFVTEALQVLETVTAGR